MKTNLQNIITNSSMNYTRIFFTLITIICLKSIGFSQITYNSSGVYNKPAGITTLSIEAWGGGGGATRGNGNEGGGGGGYSRIYFTVPSAASSYTVTVGIGGAGGANSTNGGNSLVTGAGVSITANGGGAGDSGGVGGTGTTRNGGNGGANVNSGGGGGGAGGATNALGNGSPGTNNMGGEGGKSGTGGDGGHGGTGTNGNATNGLAPGGGGGAGGNNGTSGNGANGRVIIGECVSAPSATISYSPNPVCENVTSIFPIQTGTVGGTYSTTSEQLTLNSITGEVNPSTSTTGDHTINYIIPAVGSCPGFTASFNLTILNDVTAPVPEITSLPNIVAQCQVIGITPPEALDDCLGRITGATTTVFPITTQGTFTVTWAYNDGNGNISTQNQTVIIDDTQPPSNTNNPNKQLPDVIAQCSVTTLVEPDVIDNCTKVTISHNAILPITTQGTTNIVWTYEDENGNISTQDQRIIITDTTPPVPNQTNLPDINASCEVTDLPIPTATDNCGGNVVVTYDVTFPINTQGTTIITWTYTDNHGNSTTRTQNVFIQDLIPPTSGIVTLPDIIAECEVTTLIPPVVTDNCGGPVTITYVTAPLPITTQGETIVTWKYEDENGNVETQDQKIIIQDVSAPIHPLLTTLQGCSVLAPTPVGIDNCEGEIFGTTNDPVSYSIPGTYIIHWSFTDSKGNGIIKKQTVIITEELEVDISSQTNVSCNGLSDGSVDFKVTGGASPYLISPSQTGLSAGSHTFTISDANNCTTSINVIITQPEPLSVIGLQILDACDNNMGSIELTGQGGTSPYTYSSSNGSITGNIINGLDGTYDFTVTDDYGCTATNTATITECNSIITIGALIDATNDGTINGLPAQNIVAYLSLIKENNILQTVQISNGVGVFDPVQFGTYKVVIHTNSAGSLSPNLPAGYQTFLGEGLLESGGDLNPNGIIEVVISSGPLVVNNGARIAASGEIYFALQAGGPLPVRLKSFEAKSTDSGNELSWKTEAEIGFSHFEVEKSLNGLSFEKIGLVKAFNSENNNYGYQDMEDALSAFYRLKMVDLDGKFNFSKIVFVDSKSDKNQFSEFYPNPSYGKEIEIKITTNEPKNWKMEGFSNNGARNFAKEINLKKGENLIKINPNQLSIGINIIRFDDGFGNTISKKIFNF